MATGRSRPRERELPPPLPPESRTVGQLVAETIKLYGSVFVRALPLGLVVACANQLAHGLSRERNAVVLMVAAPVFAVAYSYAAQLASRTKAALGSWVVAVTVGTLVFLPAAILLPWFALAGVVWLGLFGLAVPAAMAEGTSVGGSLRRGLELGRADVVHAVGALATLVVLFFLTRVGLALLLDSQAENTVRTAVFLADLVLSPLLFLGGALLYVDQEARLGSRHDRGKERDAHVPDADATDGEGGADPAREPRPPA